MVHEKRDHTSAMVICILLILCVLGTSCSQNKQSAPEEPSTEVSPCDSEDPTWNTSNDSMIPVISESVPAEKWLKYKELNGTICIQGNVEERQRVIVIPSRIANLPVTSIDDWAFAQSEHLTSITIPESVTDIGTNVFSDCSHLTEINVALENANYRSIDGVLFAQDGNTIYRYPAGRKNDSYAIFQGTKSIESGAFLGCKHLTSITIPKGVTNIGENAFSGCCGLTSITIPEGVTSIGYSAFTDCSRLTEMMLPSSVENVTYGAFSGCECLTTINVASGNALYEGVDGVLFTQKSATIHSYPTGKRNHSYAPADGTKVIENCAFWGNKNLKSVTLPQGVVRIGDSAFGYCRSLTTMEIPPSVTNIGYAAFLGCDHLTSITIPEGVTNIGNNAFTDCCRLTKITIPSSMECIENDLLMRCENLSSIQISEGVIHIGRRAFAGCKHLTSVEIPSSVTSIGNNAFSGCDDLTEINIPEGVTSIANGAFARCDSLTAINVAAENPLYKSVNGVLFTKDGKTLQCYPTGKKNDSYTPPYEHVNCKYYDWVTGNYRSFSKMQCMVTSIEEDAFSECRGLTEMTIPPSVTSIGDRAFSDCSGLTRMTIPPSVTSIGDRAFAGCSGLIRMTIPQSVTNIGGEAFAGCENLTIEVIHGTYAEEWARENDVKFVVSQRMSR